MSSPTPAFEPVRITVVDSEACHFCEDAHRALTATCSTRSAASSAAELEGRRPVSVKVR